MVSEVINTIDLEFATMTLRSDGIVHTHVNLREAVSIEQAKELTTAYINITQGKKYLIYLQLINL